MSPGYHTIKTSILFIKNYDLSQNDIENEEILYIRVKRLIYYSDLIPTTNSTFINSFFTFHLNII